MRQRCDYASRSVRKIMEVSQLAALFEPEVNVVVLERPLPDSLQDCVRESCATFGPNPKLLAIAPHAGGRDELRASLGNAPLADEMFRWVELFADVTEATTVGLRLVRATTAMCPRFHVDRMELRLVLTYQGPGTEFVDHALVAMHNLGSLPRGVSFPIEEAAIQRAATGDVVWLKGESWPDNQGRGAVHRSPAASPESPRLVLTLDVL